MKEEMVPVTFKTTVSNREWLQKHADDNHRSLAGQINFFLDRVRQSETEQMVIGGDHKTFKENK